MTLALEQAIERDQWLKKQLQGHDEKPFTLSAGQ